ncbi:hypothetical protein PR003_g27385 [Phytophthora rubi]|uniref:Uncharacterized protein n=1 Tax=Phytophthora rubi TaxID=129364 RepID=A0A6A4BYS4_9STRA|nr:hypothetical protein PR003_g27385 [Phytophthora rubi]
MAALWRCSRVEARSGVQQGCIVEALAPLWRARNRIVEALTW